MDQEQKQNLEHNLGKLLHKIILFFKKMKILLKFQKNCVLKGIIFRQFDRLRFLKGVQDLEFP